MKWREVWGNEAWVENSVQITLNEIRLEYGEDCMTRSYGGPCKCGDSFAIHKLLRIY
jgi:hypothetical protein